MFCLVARIFHFLLQRYYWFKRQLSTSSQFPFDVTHMLRDTLEVLRPKSKIYNSAEDTLDAVNKMEADIKRKIGQACHGQVDTFKRNSYD